MMQNIKSRIRINTFFYAIIINLLFLSISLIIVPMGYDMPDTVKYPVFIANGNYTFGFLSFFSVQFVDLSKK